MSDKVMTIEAASVAFHTCLRGAVPRAVFIHGFAGDLQTWDGVWEVMSDALPALRYDLRGYGRSVASDASSFSHADDLLAILNSIGLSQCDLIGVSMGGSVALNFALDHPERVRNLVLISPGLVAWEWSERWRDLWSAIVERARTGAMDEAKTLWWRHPLFDTVRDSAAGPALYRSIMRYSGDHWVHDNHRLMLPDVERLHQLQVRTLLLTGECDYEDFRVIADLVESSAGNIQRRDFPGRGHMLHLEDAAGCAAAILSFVNAAQGSRVDS